MSKIWNTGDQLNAADLNMMVVPLAAILPFGGITVPSNWLLCDGSAVSRSTYSDLFAEICKSLGTFTMTIASPSVFTLNSHGLVAGDAVYLTTTGALPTGFSQNTLYYVIATGLTTNTFQLSTTRGGSAINGSGSQSGTHTLRRCPYGLGDGSTTFNVPDLQQRVPVGYKNADTVSGYIGQSGGEQAHTLIAGEVPAHDHGIAGAQIRFPNGGGPSAGEQAGNNNFLSGSTATSFGGGGSHNNMQPYITMKYIIRY